MDVCEAADASYCILEEASQDNLEICESTSDVNTRNIEGKLSDGVEKPCAVWTLNATTTLLKLYESKLEMLETPKKKTRIWIAISQSLSEYGIEMTPDQVRWKINALTKKYKQCVDSGHHDKFKYFKIMNDIYSQYHVDCDSYALTELLHKKKDNRINGSDQNSKMNQESKAVIEMRKIRLANRIESDRFQGKIQLEKQWLEYLQRQEEQKQWRDEIYDRNLKLREEELELRRRELEIKETLELKKIELKEKEYRETLQIEREKCELLKEIFSKRY
ncbi:uncharacterized protein LOC111362988 [Spodoptera litura]|uniref:Uncharacterized protein LOC111351919 n=1 Tax=Spodoptera litura TaxID=69820 RepID=A0A9J7J1Q8_SPOLT|nr:uncharacterized protein LOC111351919 [Spodoptera litura]XP_022835536.1 uncharacterized protein LOC111362988 [Spodoptera litura]